MGSLKKHKEKTMASKKTIIMALLAAVLGTVEVEAKNGIIDGQKAAKKVKDGSNMKASADRIAKRAKKREENVDKRADRQRKRANKKQKKLDDKTHKKQTKIDIMNETIDDKQALKQNLIKNMRNAAEDKAEKADKKIKKGTKIAGKTRYVK